MNVARHAWSPSGALDPDLRLVQASATTRGAPARFRQSLIAEGEAAHPAASRLHNDVMTRGACRANEMFEVVLDIAASEP